MDTQQQKESVSYFEPRQVSKSNIEKLREKSLKELRRMQEANSELLRKAYHQKNYKAVNELQIREDEYTLAINKKVFEDK